MNLLNLWCFHKTVTVSWNMHFHVDFLHITSKGKSLAGMLFSRRFPCRSNFVILIRQLIITVVANPAAAVPQVSHIYGHLVSNKLCWWSKQQTAKSIKLVMQQCELWQQKQNGLTSISSTGCDTRNNVEAVQVVNGWKKQGLLLWQCKEAFH